MDHNNNKDTILEMVSNGEISPEEGAVLLQNGQLACTIIKDEIIINEKIHIPFEYRECDPALPILILFPGILMRLDSWGFLYEYPRFKNKYNILSFEHRGQWHATKYFNTYDIYTIEENSFYVHEIITKLRLEKKELHLVGISSGCLMSFDFTLKYPHLVKSTIFFGPLFVTNYTYQSKQRSVVFAIENISDKYFDDLLDTFYFDYYSENFIVRNKEAIVFFRKNVRNLCKEIPEMMLSIAKIVNAVLDYLQNIQPRMEEFKQLTLSKRIIVGEKDIICSPMLLADISRFIDADIEIVKDTGHVLLLEDDSYFLKKIENFMSDFYSKDRPRRTLQREPVSIPAKIIVDLAGIQYQIKGHVINQQVDAVTGYCFEIANFDTNKIDLDFNTIVNHGISIFFEKPLNNEFNGTVKWFNKRSLFITIGIELL